MHERVKRLPQMKTCFFFLSGSFKIKQQHLHAPVAFKRDFRNVILLILNRDKTRRSLTQRQIYNTHVLKLQRYNSYPYQSLIWRIRFFILLSIQPARPSVDATTMSAYLCLLRDIFINILNWIVSLSRTDGWPQINQWTNMQWWFTLNIRKKCNDE